MILIQKHKNNDIRWPKSRNPATYNSSQRRESLLQISVRPSSSQLVDNSLMEVPICTAYIAMVESAVARGPCAGKLPG